MCISFIADFVLNIISKVELVLRSSLMKMPYLFCLVFAVHISSAPAQAADENNEIIIDMSEPKKCLSLHAIIKTKILDEQNILFYARGKKLYRNTLPRKCSGLRPGSVISYDVRMGRLCRKDWISVQDNFADRFSPSTNCSLGAFEQIPTQEELREENE